MRIPISKRQVVPVANIPQAVGAYDVSQIQVGEMNNAARRAWGFDELSSDSNDYSSRGSPSDLTYGKVDI